MPTRLVLGTAALAQQYAGQPAPDKDEAVAMLHAALMDGVRIVDTAPAYGTEAMVARAVRDLQVQAQVLVATKISPQHYSDGSIAQSLACSHKALACSTLDIVLLHNPVVSNFGVEARVLDYLREARAAGSVRYIGASIYSEAEAAAAAEADLDYVQIPFNLLDQRMGPMLAAGVFGTTKVLARSPWLRGALTPNAPRAVPVTAYLAAGQARRRLLTGWESLPDCALRFCLHPAVAGVVVGPRTVDEWDEAVRSERRGRLPLWRRLLAQRCAINNRSATDPRLWAGVQH